MDNPEGTQQPVEYTPDFILSHRDVIHENNWPEYEAKGFFMALGVPVDNDDGVLTAFLNLAQELYGVENVYTGDAWSSPDGRPLQHKPGIGIYVHPDGRANVAAWQAKHGQNEGQVAGGS